MQRLNAVAQSRAFAQYKQGDVMMRGERQGVFFGQ